MDIKFRALKANEIECRIGQIKENGLTLLLYKDARADMNLLDESVGPTNWKREHKLIGDRLYCTVSIFDEEKGEWISKEDVGTESNTEKEKGQASDSFKRACVNWGIGRELYTSPFIWVSNKDCKIVGTNGKFKCFDKFEVEKILIDENKTITALSIKNTTNNKRVFLMKPVEKAKK